MNSVESKLWRTLVAVIFKNVYQRTITVRIPGWDSTKQIVLPYTSFPDELIPLLEKNYRLHAKVNIGAERKEDLIFTDWEWTPHETVEMQNEKLLEYLKNNPQLK